MAARLDEEQTLGVIDATPLVSVDLVVQNLDKQVLLGLRRNRPAQQFWFVPGGRILKNERIAQAISRVSVAELGVDFGPRVRQLLGAYDHLYDDNFFGKAGIETHYVALAFLFWVDTQIAIVADEQHEEMRWWSVPELLASASVHDYTKRYFQ
jgi:colanic acid biosynthesis protein WcaH